MGVEARSFAYVGNVLIPHQLARRVRPPDYLAESCALRAAAAAMAGDPQGVLERIAGVAMQACRADAAAVSAPAPCGDGDSLRWHAAPGASNLWNNLPPDSVADGDWMKRREMLLFHCGEQLSPALQNVQPTVHESLVCPWNIGGESTGGVWLVKHTPGSHFDAEDARVLAGLAPFAAAAYQICTARNEVDTAQQRHTLAESALRDIQERLQLALDAASMGTFIWRVQADIGEPDRKMLALFGLPPDARLNVELALSKLIHPDDVERFAQALARAVDPTSGGELREDVRVVLEDGSVRWLAITAQVEFEGDPPVAERMAGAAMDVTARKKTESALRASEERFRLLVENVHEYALVQTDPTGLITSWNPGAERMFGYSSAEMLGHTFSVLLTPEDYENNIFAQELAVIGSGNRNEDARWMVRRDGSRFWARWISEPVYDASGNLRGLAKIMRDETERERSEEHVRHALAEKEELLKEVHHRVKNNLQVIVSLLNMQGRQLEDEHVLAELQEARNRVLAISAIHELLYRAESFAGISMIDYARQLSTGLVRFYGLESRLRLDVEGDGHTLELERAVPFGMLLNELVSNSCKHAFPAPASGTLLVRVQAHDAHLELTVADNGHGLPPGFDYQQSTSLGLKLVHGLARQLRGDVKVISSEGTTVKVTFPSARPEPHR